MNAHMNWYLIKFVYQTKASNVLRTTEFHEAWRWVRADNDTWAKEKATVLGRMHERECTNLQFIGTAGIHKIDSVEDGAELFSSTELTARCA